MNDLTKRLQELSPEKRALLAQRLKAGQTEKAPASTPPPAPGAANTAAEPPKSRISRQPRPANGRLPVSYNQRQLWFMDQLEPGNTFYNIPSVFRLSGQLNPARLEQTLNEIIKRHEVLRTTFEAGPDGQPVQVIAPPSTIELPLTDLSDFAAAPEARQKEALRLVGLEETASIFDLRKGPLVRARLYRLAPTEHLLFLNFPHIIFDLWSLGIFVREIGEIYAAFCRGLPAPLAELPVQYADFAAWQRQHLQGESYQQQLAYWQNQLDGPLPVLELPTDRPRPPVQSYRGATHTLILPPELYDRLKQFSRQNEATPFMSLLAVFKLLLFRYTSQTDLVVGFPIAGRNQRECEHLLGYFVNSLALRSRFTPQTTFHQLLAQVRQTALQAYANQEVPFDRLVEQLQPERDLSYNPIFQTLFTYQTSLMPFELPGLVISFLKIESSTSKFDLSLDIFEGPEGPTCLFEYNTDLFEAERIERMACHYQQLLASCLDNPHQEIARLEMLTPTEHHRLLIEWNKTTKAFPRQTFHSLFEQRCAAQPAAPALSFEGQTLSYAELNRRANQLAHYLHELPAASYQQPAYQDFPSSSFILHPSSLPVIICLERSLETVVAALAVLKAGGAYLPLDPAYPADRLAFMLEDSGAKIIITRQKHLESLPIPDGMKVVCLDRDEAIIAEQNEQNPVSHTEPTDPAYIIYTSGSTGQPKGTLVAHNSLLNAYYGWEEAYGLLAESRVHLQMANFAFDVFTGDLARALGSGGKLVLVSQETLLDPARLYATLQREGVQCAEFVPAILRLLVGYLEETGQNLAFMRLIAVGSDIWTGEEYQRFRRLGGPDTRLVNSYGLTEATIDSTYFEPESATVFNAERVPVGRPFPNVKIYLLDEYGQPVPVGLPGELYIGGPGVALGYLNRPELTAQRFVTDPFEGENAKLYRTGDLARYLPDGNIELLGRSDHQVKIRGIRVELGEIEKALGRYPGVKEVVVIAREDRPGDKQLVAYLVASEDETGAAFDETALAATLKSQLPAYMCPAAFVRLKSLPLTPNGKLDRKPSALPAPDRQSNLTDTFVAPRSLTEVMLADIWGQIFGLSRVGVQDNFFQLGGHSLMAIQLASQVRQIFQVELPLQTLFQAPTIAGLAASITRLQGKAGGAPEAGPETLPQVVPDPANQHRPFPLTEVQQAYWVGRNSAFEMGNVSTHSYDEFELEQIDPEQLNWAWQQLIERHSMLRAIIRPDGTQQILEEVPPYRIELDDLRGQSAAQVEAHIEAIRQRMSHQVLATDCWPVFELRLTRLDEQRYRLHLSTDAIMFDAWSFVILLKELVHLHCNPNMELPPLELTFRDYVLGEQALRQTESYRQALEYWRQRLPDLPPAPLLPMAKHPSQVEHPHFERLQTRFEPEEWKLLKTRATRLGVTATGMLLTAFAEVLARWSKNPRFSLNLTFLSRQPIHPQVNEVVGEFTSISLLAVDVTQPASFEERARQLQGNLWNDLEHHQMSGIQVLRELNRLHGSGNQARMPVVFTSSLLMPVPDRDKSPIPVRPVYGITQTSQVWIDCCVWEDSGVLMCHWDVVRELFPEGFLEAMFEAYCKLLHRLAQDEAAWQSEAGSSLLPAAQLSQRALVNATAGPIPGGLLQDGFIEQVRQRPDEPAVIAPDATLTYAQLYRQANYIAHQLRREGAQPNRLVAVVMEKGWEQVAGVMGVLMSGAAYLPIDPDLPAERLQYLLQQAEVELVLTQPWLDQSLAWPGEVKRFIITNSEVNELAPLPAVQQATDLAYVIFTSGSTGLPKGVMIDHRGALNTIEDLNRRFGVTSADRTLALSALNFDLSLYDIFGLLAAGGVIVIPRADSRRDPAHWLDLIERHRITLWNSVPALLGMLVEYARPKGLQLPDYLKLVMLSGDWIPLNLPGQLRELSSQDLALYSLGGATEASIWSIYYPVGQVEPDWPSIPYGQPLLNQTFHVLNDNLQPCPVWVPGQLYIGGIGLAKGYWRDEQKTTASFIYHPQTGERLYRTGDLGRYLPDGNIEFLGREDFQVKVQGHRIELGEIEAALGQHPAVREAIALAAGDGSSKGHKTLVGFVVLEAANAASPAELREYLDQKLPHYMVPARLICLEKLPLTANGKIDRPALLNLSQEQARPTAEKAIAGAPLSPLEIRLVGIWAELLEMEPSKIGREDNFFELGGDSLLMVRLATGLGEIFPFEISLRRLFELDTLVELTSYLEENGAM